jgi:hypothetical protein
MRGSNAHRADNHAAYANNVGYLKTFGAFHDSAVKRGQAA